MNEEAMLIGLDMIKKKLQMNAVPIALDLIEDLETKLNQSLNRSKNIYQVTILQPTSGIDEIRNTVNQLIIERNNKVKH